MFPHHLHCVVRAPVLLQTARTTVYKLGNPDKNKQVWIIFDTGSQRSYTVKRHLSLNPVSTETMINKNFGVENQGQQVCEVVKVGMSLKNGQSLEMSFLSVPLICEPISNQPVMFVCGNCSQFASLELADSCHGDEKLEPTNTISRSNSPTWLFTRSWCLAGHRRLLQ